jgi:hypothetical protein
MSVFERGERFGLTRGQMNALKRITRWFNFHWLNLDGEKVSIATDHEPSFETLCSEINDDLGLTEYHLESQGLIEEQWIAGRPCSWSPTEQGLTAMEYVFRRDHDVYPTWGEPRQDGAPLFRDGNERLIHRKGVCAAAHVLGELVPKSRVYVYPERFPRDHRPDLTWVDGSGNELAIVEMVSDHNDLQSLAAKFRDWRHSQFPVIWVFENRKAMVSMWNYIERERRLDLDGGEFGGKRSNWPPKRVNAKIRRTRSETENYNSVDCVQTLGGILNSDLKQWKRFLERNHIIS